MGLNKQSREGWRPESEPTWISLAPYLWNMLVTITVKEKVLNRKRTESRCSCHVSDRSHQAEGASKLLELTITFGFTLERFTQERKFAQKKVQERELAFVLLQMPWGWPTFQINVCMGAKRKRDQWVWQEEVFHSRVDNVAAALWSLDHLPNWDIMDWFEI